MLGKLMSQKGAAMTILSAAAILPAMSAYSCGTIPLSRSCQVSRKTGVNNSAKTFYCFRQKPFKTFYCFRQKMPETFCHSRQNYYYCKEFQTII